MMDTKYRSRRFLFALLSLIGGFVGMMLDKDVTAFALLCGGVLGAYGFTRSKWGAADDKG